MSEQGKLDEIFQSELRYLMLVSYFVLGNNAVTDRIIERTHRMPVHAWSTLFSIALFPENRAKEVKALFPRPQNTTSRAASLMETRGLIEQQTSVADGREKKLYATVAGKKLLTEIRAVSILRQEELFDPLTNQERETFFQLARKIAACPRLLQTVTMEIGQMATEKSERGIT